MQDTDRRKTFTGGAIFTTEATASPSPPTPLLSSPARSVSPVSVMRTLSPPISPTTATTPTTAGGASRPLSPPPITAPAAALINNTKGPAGSSHALRTSLQSAVPRMPPIREDAAGNGNGNGNGGVGPGALGLADVAHRGSQQRRSRASFYQYGEDYLTSYERVGVPARPRSTPAPPHPRPRPRPRRTRSGASARSSRSGRSARSGSSPRASASFSSSAAPSVPSVPSSFECGLSGSTMGAPPAAVLVGAAGAGAGAGAGMTEGGAGWEARRGSATGRVMGRDLEKGSVGGSEMDRPLVAEKSAEGGMRRRTRGTRGGDSWWRRQRRSLVMMLVVVVVIGVAVGIAFGVRRSS